VAPMHDVCVVHAEQQAAASATTSVVYSDWYQLNVAFVVHAAAGACVGVDGGAVVGANVGAFVGVVVVGLPQWPCGSDCPETREHMTNDVALASTCVLGSTVRSSAVNL